MLPTMVLASILLLLSRKSWWKISRDKTNMPSINVKDVLNIYWILLDNQSTVHVFFNVHFLVNARKVNKELRLYTNSRMSVIDEVGKLPGFGTVWVH